MKVWYVGFAGFMATACVTSTGGEQVALTAEVIVAGQTEEGGKPVLRWQDGPWQVELSRANIAVGPLYLWSDTPNLDTAPWASLWGAPRAYAQDIDHFTAGTLVGEVPAQVRVDLLGPVRVPLGEGTAVAGRSRSAEVWLEPAADGPTVQLEGIAQNGDETYRFSADITWTAPWVDEDAGRNAPLQRRVRGLLWDGVLSEPAAIQVKVDPTRWLDAAALDRLSESVPTGDGEDGVIRLGPQDPTGRALDARIRRVAADGPWAITLGESF
jgi:hypothetical protein